MKKIKHKHITQAAFDMICYNGLEHAIIPLIHAMKFTDRFSFDSACSTVAELRNMDTYENFLWGMLVLMFGEYGTSPRVGWIEDTKGCVKFLQKIIGKMVAEQYNGDYDEFLSDYNEF